MVNLILSIILNPINEFIKIKILNKPVYKDEVLKEIGIDRSEEGIFFNENWNRSFKYVQFAEHYEAKTGTQKYVNVSELDGRKINNSPTCNKNFYFYGSSLTFGYNVKDSQTIPSFFKNILDDKYFNSKYCVFNFGSASYFSTQENILFQTHILKNRFKEGDFIFFLNGHSENGNYRSRVSADLEKLFNGINAKMLDELIFSSSIFWESLPTTKIYNILKRKFRKKNETKNSITENSKKENIPKDLINGIPKKEIKEVFQKNVFIREAICKNLKLNCYTFLQPIPNVHGIYDKKFSKDQNLSQPDLDKYNLLKDTKFIFDISDSLNNDKSPSFDANHYTPAASKSIARSVYETINKKIDHYVN